MSAGSSAPGRPICVLIAALGGQGGGVLLDWLVAAAARDGYPTQATSIAGVAQRTGATTYYAEIFPERAPAKTPVFSLYPSTGDVDLVAALEPMEAGRALGLGFIGPGTTVLTLRERVFSTAEKMLPGDGAQPAGPVLEALERAARKLIALDGPRLAATANSQANAVLFGAMAGAGALPLSKDACRWAITAAGLAAEANSRGFEAGFEAAQLPAQSEAAAEPGAADLIYDPPPAALAARVQALPDAARAMAGHGAARLVDYQDEAYARLYLDRLDRVVAIDAGEDAGPLAAAVARRLAAWMAFEDVIRVAQLKTRPGRLARIRRELGVPDAAPLVVRDFLKPGHEELEGLLPPRLARLLPAPRPGAPRKGLPLRLRTSTFWGWLVLRSLASLRAWRPHSARFAREQAAIEDWLAAIRAAAPRDATLALDTANLAVWARGYGDTRARGLDRLAGLSRDFQRRLAADRPALVSAVGDSLTAAHADPNAE